MSENIEVFSIVDRFLEHSRIFVFCNNNKPRYFTGSADWMPRNLNNRIEVTTEVHSKEIQNELWDILQIQLKDNCKARIISKDSSNVYRETGSKKKVRSQFEIYQYFKNKLEY